MKNLNVVIPTAQLIPIDIGREFGNIPPVLMQVNGGNVLQALTRMYENHATRILLGSHKGIDLINTYVDKANLPVQVIEVNRTYDVGHTIYNILCQIKFDSSDELIINFGDTLVFEDILNRYSNTKDYILEARVQDPWRWTSVSRETDRSLRFIDKDLSQVEPNYSLVGFFKISDCGVFFRCLQDTIGESLQTGKESLYQALTQYSRFKEVEVYQIHETDWTDVGHADQVSRNRIDLLARSFNSMEVDSRKGIVTKRSTNKQKLIQEINWYLHLPNELQFCIPRIFSYSLEKDTPYVSMEYYGYPSLADIFVNGYQTIAFWESILKDLKWLLSQFEEQSPQFSSSTELRESQWNMYVEKTKNRLIGFNLTQELEIISQGCILNGIRILSLQEALERVEALFSWCIPSNKQPTIIHGDFCLSNILYDVTGSIYRLIDPRGSFGSYALYGDPYYDFAKLSHSFTGYYDLIVRDRFFYNRQGNSVVFRPFTFDLHEKISFAFKKIFIGDDNELDRAVAFIESLLFLSMVPLHGDSEQRQIAMLLTGLSKFTNCWDAYEREGILSREGMV